MRDTRIFNDPANVKVIISWGKLISFQKLENIICAYQYYYPKFSQVLKTGNNVWRFFASDVLPSWTRFQFAFWKKKKNQQKYAKLPTADFIVYPSKTFVQAVHFRKKSCYRRLKSHFKKKKLTWFLKIVKFSWSLEKNLKTEKMRSISRKGYKFCVYYKFRELI